MALARARDDPDYCRIGRKRWPLLVATRGAVGGEIADLVREGSFSTEFHAPRTWGLPYLQAAFTFLR